MSAPFASASAYRAKGWSGTLPLPPGKKSPPPDGFTGYDGRWPTTGEIEAWQSNGHGKGNLGLRLPGAVVGLDIDAYGDKPGGATLAALMRRWGPLPPTWRSTARADDLSGIRLFRVPPDLEWPTEAGPGIEIIRYAHRYMVVWPSVHPEGGTYRWIRPDGTASLSEIPTLDLPDLPAAWLAGLTGHGADGDHVKPGSRAESRERGKQAGPWLASLPKGEPCRYVGRLAADLEAAATRQDGNAYDHTRDTVMAILRAGEIGHPGVLRVLDRGRAAYVQTVAAGRGGAKVAEGEYDRFTAGGVVKLLADPSERAGSGCDCEGFTIVGVTDGPPSIGLIAVTLSDVAPKPVRWLWPGRMPLGKVTILDGDPGLGKSSLMLDMAARGSVGGMTPTGEKLPLFDTIIVTTEDDAEDTLRPRLDRAGADPSRVHLVTDLTLPDDADRLERLIADKRAMLVTLDPIVEYLGEAVKTASDHAVRRALKPLVGVAKRQACAVVGIRHLNKQGGLSAIYRGGGSIGFGGLARSVLAVGRNPDDDDQMVLAGVKINVARRSPSLAYRLVADGPLEPVGIEWLGESEHDAEALIGASRDAVREKTKEEQLAAAMVEIVERNGGQMLARDMYASLEADGFDLSSENQKSRARRLSKLIFKPDGFSGAWMVSAP
jgi:hypothetical protein